MGAGTSSPTPDQPATSDLVAAKIASIRMRADAEVKRVDAEIKRADTKALADARRADEAAHDARAATAYNFVPLLLISCSAAALAIDFYTHESRTHIKRRMLRALRACRLPANLPRRSALLPTAQPPLILGSFLPRLLLGPTGCGKSSLLGELVRTTVAARVPAVLVRMRLPSSRRKEDMGTFGAPLLGPTALMDATATQVFSQIGFPPRRSLLGGLLSRGIVWRGERTRADLASPESCSRLMLALTLLFEACEQLAHEREASGVAPLDAAPVLLFDEVQDLIKDARLQHAGGRLVLDLLGTLLVSYGVDRQAVRSVVAGSSAELYFAFEESTPARGARWCYYELGDPPAAVVEGALRERGYSGDDAARMVALCGTRLRLLDGPLAQGALVLGAEDFLRASEHLGCADFAGVFSRLEPRPEDAKQLARLLDALAGGAQGVAQRALPPAARAIDLAPILYINRKRELSFQSQLHRKVWAQVRALYAAP